MGFDLLLTTTNSIHKEKNNLRTFINALKNAYEEYGKENVFLVRTTTSWSEGKTEEDYIDVCHITNNRVNTLDTYDAGITLKPGKCISHMGSRYTPEEFSVLMVLRNIK